jgi:translation initiation factor IF-2
MLLFKQKFLSLGKVTSIEENKVNKDIVTTGAAVAVKIVPTDEIYCYGRHFDFQDPLMSTVSEWIYFSF